jgi:hypothetical protein
MITTRSATSCLFFCALIFFSCSKDKYELGNKAVASFSVTPVTGKANTYLLTSTSQNAFRYQWDIGAGQGIRGGKEVDTAYFLFKGTYNIKLYAHGRGGFDTAVQTVTVANDDLTPILNNPTFQALIAKSWKFDPDPNSKAVIVGTESNPAAYFGGGALASCQLDDVYTFAFVNNSFQLTYAANGSTFNGGNVSPNFACGGDRSFTSNFTFSSTVDGAGIATITLPGGTPPNRFIGVTDVSSNNFRIISISPTAMVLRSGKKNETVHQFKFIAQ